MPYGSKNDHFSFTPRSDLSLLVVGNQNDAREFTVLDWSLLVMCDTRADSSSGVVKTRVSRIETLLCFLEIQVTRVQTRGS